MTNPKPTLTRLSEPTRIKVFLRKKYVVFVGINIVIIVTLVGIHANSSFNLLPRTLTLLQ